MLFDHNGGGGGGGEERKMNEFAVIIEFDVHKPHIFLLLIQHTHTYNFPLFQSQKKISKVKSKFLPEKNKPLVLLLRKLWNNVSSSLKMLFHSVVSTKFPLQEEKRKPKNKNRIELWWMSNLKWVWVNGLALMLMFMLAPEHSVYHTHIIIYLQTAPSIPIH